MINSGDNDMSMMMSMMMMLVMVSMMSSLTGTGTTTTPPVTGGGADPVVQTLMPSNITSTSATMNANLASMGTSSPTSASVKFAYYKVSDGNGVAVPVVVMETTPAILTAPGLFHADLTGLSPKSTYAYMAYAGNANDIVVRFVTDATAVAPPTTGPFTVYLKAINYDTAALGWQCAFQDPTTQLWIESPNKSIAGTNQFAMTEEEMIVVPVAIGLFSPISYSNLDFTHGIYSVLQFFQATVAIENGKHYNVDFTAHTIIPV